MADTGSSVVVHGPVRCSRVAKVLEFSLAASIDVPNIGDVPLSSIAERTQVAVGVLPHVAEATPKVRPAASERRLLLRAWGTWRLAVSPCPARVLLPLDRARSVNTQI